MFPFSPAPLLSESTGGRGLTMLQTPALACEPAPELPYTAGSGGKQLWVVMRGEDHATFSCLGSLQRSKFLMLSNAPAAWPGGIACVLKPGALKMKPSAGGGWLACPTCPHLAEDHGAARPGGWRNCAAGGVGMCPSTRERGQCLSWEWEQRKGELSVPVSSLSLLNLRRGKGVKTYGGNKESRRISVDRGPALTQPSLAWCHWGQ